MSKLIKKHRGHLGRRGGLRYGAGSWAKYSASAKMRNTQKPCQYALAKTSTGGGMKKKNHKKKGMQQRRNGSLYLSCVLRNAWKMWAGEDRVGGAGGRVGIRQKKRRAEVKPLVGMLSVGDLRSATMLGPFVFCQATGLAGCCRWILEIGVCVWESRNRRSNEARCLPTS